jgi:hypothetical protein
LEKEWPGIYISTVGMVFFGTPFRGAEGMQQSELLEAAASEYGEGQVQGAVLNILAPGNETLEDLVDAFFTTTKYEKTKAHIACFYEQKPSNVGAIVGGKKIIVCSLLLLIKCRLTEATEIRR